LFNVEAVKVFDEIEMLLPYSSDKGYGSNNGIHDFGLNYSIFSEG
jgi:hypothetical protein